MRSIESELRLIPFGQLNPSDVIAEQYLEWFNDDEVTKYLFSTLPKTREAILSWLLACINRFEYKYYHLLYKGENIGHIGRKNYSRHAYENGIVIGNQDFWGKGLGSLSLQQLQARDNYRSQSALSIAYINQHNLASQKLFSKHGFILTGQIHHLEPSFQEYIKIA